MIDTLQNLDPELDLLNISKYDIINSITLEDVKNFLESLGVDRIEMNAEKGYLICPTICHNPLHEAESMKLYWYQDHKIFKCYTECNEAMSIFKLYQKFMNVNQGQKIDDDEAEDYVKKCLRHITIVERKRSNKLALDLSKYQYNNHVPILDAYPEQVLSCFIKYYHPCWLKDGITKSSMDKFNILFSLGQNKIVIPHYDIKHRLVGIRGRALEKIDIEEFGKYRPIQVGSILYTHPLQFNLYGIYEHQKGIMRRRTAIIAEGEKSVLLDDGYYQEWSNCVACCGSSFNKYHISLLTDILGANEIVIAFDKEYKDWQSQKAITYREKIENMCRRYKNQATFSYLWDRDNLLQEKDSPFDKGKDIFDYLYKNRIKVR